MQQLKSKGELPTSKFIHERHQISLSPPFRNGNAFTSLRSAECFYDTVTYFLSAVKCCDNLVPRVLSLPPSRKDPGNEVDVVTVKDWEEAHTPLTLCDGCDGTWLTDRLTVSVSVVLEVGFKRTVVLSACSMFACNGIKMIILSFFLSFSKSCPK